MIVVDWESILPPWLGDALPLGIFITDSALAVRYWSPWLATQTGRSAEELCGRSLLKSFPELDERGVGRHFRRALDGEIVTLTQREHGYLLPIPAPPNAAGLDLMQQRAVLSPLALEGDVVGILTVITDLTERSAQDQLLQQTLARQEETLALLNTLITKAPIGFAFLDTQLRYRGINERLAEFNGIPVEAHMGRTIWEIVPSLADQQVELFTSVIATGIPLTNIELNGETKARPGVPRVWQASYYPVRTVDQRRVGVGVLVTEITEQRRTEQVERFMAGLAVALTDSLDYQLTLDGIARATVPFLADWCVIEMVGETLQSRFSAVAHAEPVRQAVARELQRRYPPPLGPDGPVGSVLHEGQSILIPALSDEQIRASAVDSDHLTLIRALDPGSVMVVPLIIGGVGIGVIALVRTAGAPAYTPDDLALAEEVARRAAVSLEKLRLFAAAERSRAMAEEAVRVRDAFFSIAAHELRTPLTTLLGRAQLLQKWLAEGGGAESRNLRSMRIIVEQAQRLNRMITALLDVSRIQSGRFSIEPAPLDLAGLVRRVVDETRLTVSSHTISLRAPDAPVMVEGDEVRLEQVIQNLVSNAVKYSPGGGEVQVEVARGDGKAQLTVSDCGIGIPETAHDQLFRRFYRAGNAESLGISGLGIGLFVVNEIVELHGGQIGVVSAEGEGSTFTVCLPLLRQGS